VSSVSNFAIRIWTGLIYVCDDRATEQMREYKPGEHSDTANVAPLVQFFELVHIGDTIQSITQVYFDKELVRKSFW
jgi:hypothetical protein